ncbi:MAG: thioredoxin [Peptococcaceae bacterium]|jgi:thioredoxin 1|nr:thioredoxin [Peptococcaceae bacterium]
MNKKTLVRFIIIICILLMIVGIWIFKNKSEIDFSLEVTEINLEELKSYNLPIIIDFGADYCLPCLEMAPILEKINKEMQGKAIIKYVDISQNPEAAGDIPILALPTQVFVNADGTPYIPSSDLNLQFNQYRYKDTGEHAYTVHYGMLTEAQLRSILSEMGVTE